MADPAADPESPANPIEPVAPESIQKPKLLLGEGIDEVYFLSGILRHLNITDVQVEQYGGKNKLKEFLEVLPIRPGFNDLVSLGITRDSDKKPRSSFQSICDALRSNGLPIPRIINRPVAGPPKTVVLLFPGRRRKGMLEDLCLASVANEKAMSCVDEFFKCARKRAGRKPKILSKARVHAWLASQEKSDLWLGEAAQKGYWPWDSPVFDDLKKFLRVL